MEPRKDPQSEWQTKIERLIKDAGGREKLPTSAQANTLLKEAPNGGYVLTKSKQGLAISYVWDGNIKLQSVRAKDAASLAVKVVTNIQQWGQSRLLFQPISGAMVDYLLGDVLRVEGDLDNCLKALRAHIEKNTESTNFFQIRQIEIADRSIEELPIQEFQKLIQLILLLLEHGAPLKSVHSQKEAEILSGAVEHFPALIKRCIKESDVKTLDEFCKAFQTNHMVVKKQAEFLQPLKRSIQNLQSAIEAPARQRHRTTHR